ncbi:hypothetical protein UFOVP1608_10 [uncultured Caudovirales phage]|uniref:Uncharacterized protein n=1 Tax=uncultured Caudovirales phage TaxID=2100421 RepID=A0A6J5SSR6_9CAUD|nr:hypothetical protein UFOVP1608_10 [uncultured Caudovirales phage]
MEEPSLGEVVRLLTDLKKQVEELPAKIDQTFVRKDVFSTIVDGMIERLTKLESRQEWLVRTVGAIVILAVVGGALALSK